MSKYLNSDYMPLAYNRVEAFEHMLIQLKIVNEDDQWGIDETEDYALELDRKSKARRSKEEREKFIKQLRFILFRGATRGTS